jgi:hypothetical protein
MVEPVHPFRGGELRRFVGLQPAARLQPRDKLRTALADHPRLSGGIACAWIGVGSAWCGRVPYHPSA